MPPIKKNQVTPEDAKLLVQQYMKDQYRPYSTTDIQLNMHNILTKAKLTNVLESLVSDNELICKTIGKTNYYTYKQLNVDDSSGDNPKEDYDSLQKQVKELNQEIGELKIDVCATPTNEELAQQIANYTTKIDKLKNELKKSQRNEIPRMDPKVVSDHVAKLKRTRKQRYNMVWPNLNYDFVSYRAY
ncbi:hypothetical protein JTP64_004860 [Candida tropicalis]|nr:hypothetical protein JTP64_004860 [Candida tropicalis]